MGFYSLVYNLIARHDEEERLLVPIFAMLET